MEKFTERSVINMHYVLHIFNKKSMLHQTYTFNIPDVDNEKYLNSISNALFKFTNR